MQEIQDYLQKEVANKSIPGAVLSVSKKGKTVFRESVGYASVYPEKKRMTTETIFDLASLTKVVVTLPLTLMLLDKQFLSLDTKVSRFVPSFQKEGKEAITIRHLLTHTSGLKAHHPFYKEERTSNIPDKIASMPLLAFPGKRVIYSDLNFILLHHIIENVTKTDLPTFANEQLFTPLNMKQTSFSPTTGSYASTEWDESTRQYLHGIVHDENARYFGGVSGHAGLFSTVEDLESFSEMVEQNGFYKGKQLISESLMKQSKQSKTEGLNERRGLGWMLKDYGYASCGERFTSFSYGHTGFTGTSMWFDPLDGLSVIFLTNRVHYGRENKEIIRIRAELHDLIKRKIERI
ncbi:serine hydrolase domain-containing protein [Bacillus sp. Marseille-P3800]|uniref:serine hydrolase domain-containing protein n=1 Tax=Bacillus sp. Marseille-P3800 TaxID=2014782 RepID=UPI000C083F58|nr:serine hydrolase domain-containing protein [Bacillus sp. Marseille-P3800]